MRRRYAGTNLAAVNSAPDKVVVRETEKGLTVESIARKHRLDPGLVEQIVRLYVTHPGVTVEGIMTKMGLLGKL